MSRCGGWGVTVLMPAWVLWTELVPPAGGPRQWDIWQAYETQSDCQTDLRGFLNFVRQQHADSATVTGNTVTTTRGNTRGWITRYVCLPDSVDPRPQR
jgi:hypothetical protein